MYELANSFRHGWGVEKDPVAARSYYETAANLGDADAMNEVARMYEAGEGGKKDKVSRNPILTTIHHPNAPKRLCADAMRRQSLPPQDLRSLLILGTLKTP